MIITLNSSSILLLYHMLSRIGIVFAIYESSFFQILLLLFHLLISPDKLRFPNLLPSTKGLGNFLGFYSSLRHFTKELCSSKRDTCLLGLLMGPIRAMND